MQTLTKMQRRVLDTVNSLYRSKGQFPPIGSIARRLGRSPATISEHVDVLEAKGFVKRLQTGPFVLIQPLGADCCPWCQRPL